MDPQLHSGKIYVTGDGKTAKGLCTNCDDKSVCQYPRFGDSVIFCEEYNPGGDFERTDRPAHRIFEHIPDSGPRGLILGWEPWALQD